jgi:hypothetical protein
MGGLAFQELEALVAAGGEEGVELGAASAEALLEGLEHFQEDPGVCGG